MDFTIKPLDSKKDRLKFIKCQWNFYKDSQYWVPPLIADKMDTLDTEKNPFYKHSQIQMFLAYSGKEVVGRIAAIVNGNHLKTHNDGVGFFGFFECINNQEVANGLFATAAAWLKEKGIKIMRGPANPSFNDEIGFLSEGFDSIPLIMMPYNPPYYLDLTEKAGFSLAKTLLAYHVTRESMTNEKLKRLQAIVRERNQITVRAVNFKDKVQFPKDVETIKEIYNAAWVPNWGFVKWTEEEFDHIAKALKMIAMPELALIADVKGVPAGFALALPNINIALKYNKNGGLIPGIWHLLTKKKKINWIRIIALGTKPEYQKIGLDAVMYSEIGDIGPKHGIFDGEASWILEDNVMMNRALTTTMYAEPYKKYRIYDKEI